LLMLPKLLVKKIVKKCNYRSKKIDWRIT